MKKSSFTALMLGTVSVVFFALGMCMTLLPEWNAFSQGIIFGCIGLVLGFITIVVWRKMEHKKPLEWNKRTLGLWLFGIFGALVFGTGMCLCMIWMRLILGTLIGCIGILLLLLLIPITKGLK